MKRDESVIFKCNRFLMISLTFLYQALIRLIKFLFPWNSGGIFLFPLSAGRILTFSGSFFYTRTHNVKVDRDIYFGFLIIETLAY